MDRKTVDHPRKTVESGVKTVQSGPMARRCYKSFRQNGDVFGRNSLSSKDLELWYGCVIFMCNAHNDLRPKTTVARMADYRNAIRANGFGQHTNFRSGGTGIQSITSEPIAPRSARPRQRAARSRRRAYRTRPPGSNWPSPSFQSSADFGRNSFEPSFCSGCSLR
jgi:hypothetical protein